MIARDKVSVEIKAINVIEAIAPANHLVGDLVGPTVNNAK